MNNNDNNFIESLTNTISKFYGYEVCLARSIALRAFDEQHSSGYDAVKDEAFDLAEWCKDTLTKCGKL